MASEPKLKPCPFCGGKGSLVEFGFGVFVCCEQCRIWGPQKNRPLHAANAWNRRHEPAVEKRKGS